MLDETRKKGFEFAVVKQDSYIIDKLFEKCA